MVEDESGEQYSLNFKDQTEYLLFSLISTSAPDEVVAETTKVPMAAIKAVRRIAEIAACQKGFDFNSLIEMIGDWQEAQDLDRFMLAKNGDVRGHGDEAKLVLNGQGRICPSNQPQNGADRRAMLNDASRNLSVDDMRTLARSLIKLADALDQAWSPSRVASQFHWITHAGRLERNSLELSKVAMRVRELGKRRERFLPAELLGEPCWQMLLELFIQFAGGAKVSTKSLSLISGSPDTTAHRLIDRLEDAGLIKRSTSTSDKRVTLVELTRKGVLAVGSALKALDC